MGSGAVSDGVLFGLGEEVINERLAAINGARVDPAGEPLSPCARLCSLLDWIGSSPTFDLGSQPHFAGFTSFNRLEKEITRMAKCYLCQADTSRFSNSQPICLRCADKADKANREATRKKLELSRAVPSPSEASSDGK